MRKVWNFAIYALVATSTAEAQGVSKPEWPLDSGTKVRVRAMALGPNYNEISIPRDRMKSAYQAVQKGLTLAATAPPHEREYLQALAKRFSSNDGAGQRQLWLEYRDAMAALMRRYPDDLDAATLC